jgi:Rrf2 family protein
MLSSTAEYALRIMIALTEGMGGPLTSERIAKTTQVPTDYAVKVLQMLGRARLVRAQRGRGGGFQLSCDPTKTSLLDVVNAIDPLQRIDSCPLSKVEHRGELCPLHKRIDEVTGLLESSFAKMTLMSVVEESPGSTLCQAVVTPTVSGRGKTGARTKTKTKRKTSTRKTQRRKTR